MYKTWQWNHLTGACGLLEFWTLFLWCHFHGLHVYQWRPWKNLVDLLNVLYHGIGGISLGIFFVLQGALKLPAQFLPKIPPRIVRGKPTEMTNKQTMEYVTLVHTINSIASDHPWYTKKRSLAGKSTKINKTKTESIN